MSVYLIPWKNHRAKRGVVATIGRLPDGEQTIAILGRRAWKTARIFRDITQEEYVERIVLEHETLHIVLDRLEGRDVSKALDRKWPFLVPR